MEGSTNPRSTRQLRPNAPLRTGGRPSGALIDGGDPLAARLPLTPTSPSPAHRSTSTPSGRRGPSSGHEGAAAAEAVAMSWGSCNSMRSRTRRGEVVDHRPVDAFGEIGVLGVVAEVLEREEGHQVGQASPGVLDRDLREHLERARRLGELLAWRCPGVGERLVSGRGQEARWLASAPRPFPERPSAEGCLSSSVPSSVSSPSAGRAGGPAILSSAGRRASAHFL